MCPEKGASLKVRKAIIPAAGLGTRFLPATKVVPKELFPLVDRPLIHEVANEAVASGISDLLLVTAMGKSAIEDYFDIDHGLENFLEAKGNEKINYDGEIHTAANLYDALKEGYYGKF